MPTRTIIAVFIALVITIAVSAVWSAPTIERDGDTMPTCLKTQGRAPAPKTIQRREAKSCMHWLRP